MAKEFITPLTLATLSKNPILVDFFNPENGEWNSHVNLGLWADIYLIAPATANTIAKMAHGIADNLLLTSYLSARSKIMVAPAMDLDMFKHQSTIENLKILEKRGNLIIEPSVGELASGLEGQGRMEEPENIVNYIRNYFSTNNKLIGKKILVTAGPTYEAIDPVRFIGNHSSGKMGYAIAEVLAESGAKVILVSGPVNIAIKNSEIELINVTSAQQMHDVCLKEYQNCNAAIMSAAVSDYTPENPSIQKIKRKTEKITIELKANPDIAFELGKIKKEKQILVGFALETENALNNAIEKLNRKNFDFIVVNSLGQAGTGFNTETNQISMIDKNNKIEHFELKNKTEVAKDIAEKLCSFF